MDLDPDNSRQHRVIHTDAVDGRERYQLLTSLVVPRPIGWVSTRAAGGVLNVAPFSFFSAVASSPMLVSLSIGTRGGAAKDSLRNILDQRAFCVNVVTEAQLEAMNRTAANLPPEADEFAYAGLSVAEAETVDAPYVANCPAVLECELHKHVDLGEAGGLVLGEVKADPYGFSQTDLDKLSSVAADLLPNRVVLAAPGLVWPTEIEARAVRLSQEQRDIGVTWEIRKLKW